MLHAPRPAAAGPPALLESVNFVDQSQVLMVYDFYTIEEIESVIFTGMTWDFTLIITPIIIRVSRDIKWAFGDSIVAPNNCYNISDTLI